MTDQPCLHCGHPREAHTASYLNGCRASIHVDRLGDVAAYSYDCTCEQFAEIEPSPLLELERAEECLRAGERKTCRPDTALIHIRKAIALLKERYAKP